MARTYFHLWGFSINEGYFPNLHVEWFTRTHDTIGFYVALSPKLRFWKFHTRKPRSQTHDEA